MLARLLDAAGRGEDIDEGGHAGRGPAIVAVGPFAGEREALGERGGEGEIR